MLRIVAGSRGSRRIDAPSGRGTRPTSDRVREALFSMLGDVAGARVLDLFAGSGALGIESLSRGAHSAVFVDRAAPAVECIARNLDSLELAGASEVMRSDWKRALEGLARRGDRFDLVFLDPPYADCASVGSELGAPLGPLLADGAMVVFESGADPVAVEGLRLRREKRYGGTVVRLYDCS